MSESITPDQPCAEHLVIDCPACERSSAGGQGHSAAELASYHQAPEYDYVSAVTKAQNECDDRLASVRRDLDEGSITIREASDERILVLSEHLAALIRLRMEYLGGDR